MKKQITYEEVRDLLGVDGSMEYKYKEGMETLVLFMNKHGYEDTIFPGDYDRNVYGKIICSVDLGHFDVLIIEPQRY